MTQREKQTVERCLWLLQYYGGEAAGMVRAILRALLVGFSSMHTPQFIELWATHHGREFTVSLGELKRRLGCRVKYTRFADFRANVIEPVQTDLERIRPFGWRVTARVRRRVTEVTFYPIGAEGSN